MRDIGLRLTSSLPVLSRRELMRSAAAGLVAASVMSPLKAFAATQVNWLGWQGYDEPLKVGDFLAKNDIELAATYLASNDEIVTKLAAGAPIDIVTPYMGYVPYMREADLIQPIQEEKVPNLSKVIDVFRNDKNIYADGKHWGVPLSWGGGPMVYDPAVLTPTSWFDLIKPEYKGKIGIMDEALGMMLTTSIMVSGAEVASLVTPRQLQEIKNFLIKLKKEHARAIFPTYGEAADAMARGEVVMTLGGAEWLPAIVAEKKKLAYTYPKEGCFAFIDSYVVPKSAPNVDLAPCYGQPRTYNRRPDRAHEEQLRGRYQRGRRRPRRTGKGNVPLRQHRRVRKAMSLLSDDANRDRRLDRGLARLARRLAGSARRLTV
ncbi:MAG: extracellular solute-binding protein [Devosia sp.]|uniref:ABC transporter substrate-binding protein n=1 Tax=Devosia sp. TaxID=1871048 RepID=UPI001A5CE348|nr:extracellular solute-binding protein [Devosia sp.]MBL8598954.1 extracellular solute-binding protein [Devosia sp.]